ncbi:hypothetical protein GC175_30340 [bacterium]|nr:hypothetical protein [bacterium]
MTSNLFSTLSRYDDNSPENYLTESFVYLLRLLYERRPAQARQLLSKLCNQQNLPTGDIVFQTQKAVRDGWVDIAICLGDAMLVYVEVKHDSPLGPGQLEYYYCHLQQEHVPTKQMVLLTRSRISALDTKLEPANYHHVCWYEVYDWLAMLYDVDEVSIFVVSDFMAFLEEKQMNLRKVTWEYERGVRAMLDLATMLEIAITEAISNGSIRKTAGWNWRGFYVQPDFFVGFRFHEPMYITFENNNGNSPSYSRRFSLENSHFLALTDSEQFEQLVIFIRDAYEHAPKKTDVVTFHEDEIAV